MLKEHNRRALILVILIAFAFNAVSFCVAFPQTFKPESASLARDFSAYYIAEWRLFHNPSDIYLGGVQRGDYQILPQPQTFKYPPSFLVLFAPFLALNYQNALIAFDVLQFGLIPILAFFVYKLVKDKKAILASVVAVIVLAEPLPSLFVSGAVLNIQSFGPAYYTAYFLANAHVLQTVLLVGALYCGFINKPWFSALLFAFGVLDPRAAVLAFPLLLWYNRHSILKFLGGLSVFLAITNVPFFFFYGISFSFLRVELNWQIGTQLYQYDWIPIYSIAALTALEMITHFSRNKAGTKIVEK